MSDEEPDNSVVWLGWAIIIALYLFGTAVWNFGWTITVLVLVSVVTIPSLTVLLVQAYLVSEGRRYRIARREIRLLTKWTLRRMDGLKR